MSLTKKDPSLRVAANDPHLVSLGGGRLSTAVTIHNIPIGDTSIGSSPACNISLNGSGVRATHCTIYRSEANEVTLVPESDEARILIDGTKITEEANLTQGAMITIGNSNYLRFNNPAEAQFIRSVMGSNERISMPHIDFTQRNSLKSNGSANSSLELVDIDAFYEQKINPLTEDGYENLDINGLQCPKVFSADLVTVNLPAKDVLGQKYANFAKNFAENHRHDKNMQNSLRNNQIIQNSVTSLTPVHASSAHKTNGMSNFIQNNATTGSNEYLAKVNNTSLAYDRYPKPGSYGGLQIYHMNGVNYEMNAQQQQQQQQTTSVDERLEDMLKICSEYAERQQQNGINSSPIVQNRIKTNGSLPREKKSPFYATDTATATTTTNVSSIATTSTTISIQNTSTTTTISSGYENVRLLTQNRNVEIVSNQTNANNNVNSSRSGYENVVVGKYVPQSPRTKIRTTCMSPKKEHSFNNSPFAATTTTTTVTTTTTITTATSVNTLAKQQEYAQLIKTFEQKLQLELQAIEESSRYKPPTPPKPVFVGVSSLHNTPIKRLNKNINNLSLNLQQQSRSLQNSPQPSKKPAPAPRGTLLPISKVNGKGSTDSLDELLVKLKRTRQTLLQDQQRIKHDISELQRHDGEAYRELGMEKALVNAEVKNLTETVAEQEQNLQELKTKIHRLEAQRNATRVMEETQQAKLKQSIEMKQEQVKKLQELLLQKPNNECLKEELYNVSESLENDRKIFEDLEFQYLEEESEWHAYREELHLEQTDLNLQLDSKRLQLQQLNDEESMSQTTESKQIQNNLSVLMNELENCEQNLKLTENKLSDISCKTKRSGVTFEDKETSDAPRGKLMSQSLFGSAELLCVKRTDEDLMSKSVNEYLFFNNIIETTSTPKQTATTLKIMPMDNVDVDQQELSAERMKCNLSLGSEDFEVNPLEKRVPSQDDIDRICKVTSDAPISAKGASTRIINSIKEIERNRQLLLAQQGHHVIEHERQRMFDLKKKSHDEARAQYLSMFNGSTDCQTAQIQQKRNTFDREEVQELNEKSTERQQHSNVELQLLHTTPTATAIKDNSSQRHSQPEFQADELRANAHLHVPGTHHPRPLSATNSDLCCDILTDNKCNYNSNSSHNITNKSSLELNAIALRQACVLQRFSAERVMREEAEAEAERKRSSVNSTETQSAGSGNGSSGGSAGSSVGSGGGAYTERKRTLPKHQRPLTRYLPIFSPDLNLRHHIETAGHQISLCPHVFIDAYSCRGYLHKLGATFHTWARRWFVLDRQRSAFIYYADKTERKPRGGAYFSTIDEVYMDHLNASKSGRPHCTFIVKTKKRSYHLQAASDAAARIWIDAIITGAQGNIDY